MVYKNLYTLSETASILGLSLTTIRRWSASGRLPTIKFSKRTIRVSKNVIETMFNNGLPIRPVREVENA